MLKDVFDMEKLESSLGGQGKHEPYSHEEYTKQMEDEDALIASVMASFAEGAVLREDDVFYESSQN